MLTRNGLTRPFAGVELPWHIGEAFPLALPDAIRVLGVQADFAVLIHDLWMQRENHVLFQRKVSLRSDRWIFQHGRSNAMAGKMPQRETMLGESVGNRT